MALKSEFMTQDSASLLIEPDQLQKLLGTENLLVVDLCQPSVYQSLHVPGAVHVSPTELVSGTPPATGKLPSVERLQALFSRLGYSPEQLVVAYDDEGGGWAGRFLWTLDVIGHRRYAYLNGGIHAWINECLPVDSAVVERAPGQVQINLDRSVVADKQEVLAAIDNPDVLIWDARSAEEYRGIRRGALRNGHIPGAINLDWLEIMDRNDSLRLLPRERLQQRLAAAGLTAGKQIITHCQSHHRSGLTYLVGRILGLEIKAYDGSWSEWGNLPDTPVET